MQKKIATCKFRSRSSDTELSLLSYFIKSWLLAIFLAALNLLCRSTAWDSSDRFWFKRFKYDLIKVRFVWFHLASMKSLLVYFTSNFILFNSILFC